MTIYWPKVYAEEIVEYIPESLLAMVGCTTIVTLAAEPDTIGLKISQNASNVSASSSHNTFTTTNNLEHVKANSTQEVINEASKLSTETKISNNNNLTSKVSRSIFRSNKILRTFAIASMTFTGALISMNIEHYAYKFFLHNPIPFSTKNNLVHAIIGSSIGNTFLGLSFAKSLSMVGIQNVPYLFVILIIMSIHVGKNYADYLYDQDFYDKRYYRTIIRNRDDQDTLAKLRMEQSTMERIQQKRIESMLQKHERIQLLKNDKKTDKDEKEEA